MNQVTSEINRIFTAALSGEDRQYWCDQYIRWGLVERHINQVVLDALSETKPLTAREYVESLFKNARHVLDGGVWWIEDFDRFNRLSGDHSSCEAAWEDARQKLRDARTKERSDAVSS